MAVILTAVARVRDWQALRCLNREMLIGRAREMGMTRYRIYRNVRDATQALIVAECPDEEAGQELCRDIRASIGTLPEGDGNPDDRVWEVTTLEGIG
jgi:hypothetical protein